MTGEERDEMVRANQDRLGHVQARLCFIEYELNTLTNEHAALTHEQTLIESSISDLENTACEYATPEDP